MTTGLLSAELSATCNALGYNVGAKYFIDPYAKETVKDLIRYLRRDDDDHQIRRHLGHAKVLQTDLIPIILQHSDEGDLFDVVLRLVVNLTHPALLLYHEEVPTEKTARNHYLQIMCHLQSYKEAFVDQKVWNVLAKKLGDLLQIEYQERDEDMSRTIERILILARNVLHVPVDPEVEKRPDNDASTHDQVLWALHQASMVDIFLYIASTENEQQFYLHILEIVALMLREQKPSVLASSAVQRTVEEKEKDETELLAIRQEEIKEKRQKVKKYTGSRHSRFGGTFVIKDVKSISDNDVIYHKTLDKVSNLTFDSEKKKVKTPKNLLAMKCESWERKSAFSIRLFLKEFCVEFMNGAYNPLMKRVKENLVRATGQPNDESYYFWAMKFFMEFNRKYKFEVKLISETMSKQTFHFVQTQLETWHEMMITDKKKVALWSRRMHLAIKVYQELLYTLMAMDKSSDFAVRESSRVIKCNVFYMPEYRELIVTLLNIFNEIKFTREYLKDLVSTAHIFLKMLEQYTSGHSNLMVQAKKRNKSKKKKQKKKSDVAVNLEAVWEEVGPQLSVVLQSPEGIPTDIVPFDAASDVDMDQQKVEAMKKIQLQLKQGNFEEAVGLLRASREVWPENDSFGNSSMLPEEEFLAMRDIFLADIGQLTDPSATNGGQSGSEDDEENEEDEQVANLEAREQNLNFFDFVKRFATPKIVAALCLLLRDFDKNSDEINHCVAKILHRITWDCKCPAMLFQASVFRTFQRLMASTNPKHKELAKLAKYIVRKFYEVSLINKKVFLEMLFWKSSKDAYEIEFGYGTEKGPAAKNMWTEEQEDELRRLFIEYERDEPEPDCVEWIMKNLIKQDRSKRSIVKKLKELYLWVPNKNKSKSSRPSKEFSEEETEELRNLYNEYQNAYDPMACIMGRLTVQRPRNKIVEKLLAMGLVQEKRQLYKKRARKNKSVENHEIDLDTATDSSDSSTTTSQRKVTKVKTKSLPRNRQVSSRQIVATLHKVLDAGLQEALSWLLSCLNDVLEDLDDTDDNSEGTALLPLSETSVCAMDNPIFLQFLDIIDINKPTDQEVYWRIPGQWKADDLNKRISVIGDALQGNLAPVVEGAEDSDSADVTLQPKIKKRIKKKKSTLDPEGVSSQTSIESTKSRVNRFANYILEDGGNSTANFQKNKSKRPVDSDSDTEEENVDDPVGLPRSDADSNHAGVKFKTRQRIVESGSENESQEENQIVETSNVTSIGGSDIENNSSFANLEKIEKDNHKRNHGRSRKVKRVIDSSSEDEDVENNCLNKSATSRIESSDEEILTSTQKSNNTVTSNVVKEKKRRITDDSSDSSDEEILTSTQKSNDTVTSNVVKEKKRRITDDSSESSDEEILTSTQKSNDTVTSNVVKEKKRTITDDSSDEESTSINHSSFSIDQSKVDETSVTEPSQNMETDFNDVPKKRKRIIESSSEDESTQEHKLDRKKKSRIVSDSE